MTVKLQNQLKFLEIADGMKNIFRKTTLIDGSRYENDAEHSWHFALMAITLFEHCALDGANIDRVIKMAILHDMVELYAGDTPAQNLAANATAERARTRMLPVKTAIPSLWQWVEDAIETNVEKGLLL